MKRNQKVVWTLAAVIVAGSLQGLAAGEDKAAGIMAETRKAIGGRKLEGMKSFSVQAKVQRNMGNIQLASDVEFLLEMPDKFLRSEAITGGPMPMAITTTAGFNGTTPLGRVNAPGMPGGAGMVIRMGSGGTMGGGGTEKLTPEQQAEISANVLRTTRNDISRLMLGWFGTAHPVLPVEYVYAGEAESPDGRAHVIDVKGAGDFAARLFIDQDTHLPLMLTYKAPQMRMTMGGMRQGGPGGAGAASRPAGREMTEEEREKMRAEIEKMRAQPPEMVEYSLFFGDWREADGIKFPHSIQRAAGGTTDEEWTLSKPRVNPKIDPKKFLPDTSE